MSKYYENTGIQPNTGDIELEVRFNDGRFGRGLAREFTWDITNKKCSIVSFGAFDWADESALRKVLKVDTMTPEQDPTGRNPHEPGAKLDAGKPSVRRGFIKYFPRAILAVSAVSDHGQKKYTWGGWKEVPDGINRYGDAELRHMCYEAMGQLIDRDSEALHAAHEAWNAMARLELILCEMEKKSPEPKFDVDI